MKSTHPKFEKVTTGQDSILLSTQNASVELNKRLILDEIDFEVNTGEIVTVIGPNGAGKSTLMKAILGLLPLKSGRIVKKQGIRIGYMPQNLPLPEGFPLTVKRFLQLTQTPDVTAAGKVLEDVGMKSSLKQEMKTLSGGEFQRVLLARALLTQPDLLVLDEPVQGVDITGQIELYQLINNIRDKYHCGVILVSHDLHLVMASTDTVVCLNHHICCKGRPETVTQDPTFVALFGESHHGALAVYAHKHTHEHDVKGEVVETKETQSKPGDNNA